MAQRPGESQPDAVVVNLPTVNNMKMPLNRSLVLLAFAFLLGMAGMGCNTAHGFGKDVERAGEKIQDGTK